MEDRFEENLRTLLTRAYEPPPYRQEFYDALLARLKAEQKQRKGELLAQAARRKRLAFAVALIAASVALMVSAGVMFNISGRPREMPAGAVERADISQALAGVERDRAQPAKGESSARFYPLRAICAAGGLAYQIPGGDKWLCLDAEAFDFQPGMSLQVPSSGSNAIAHFRLGNDQTAVALQPATVLCNDDGRLTLLNGGLYATVGARDVALEMAVADCCFIVAPGSEIFVKKEAKSVYAVKGEPAPQLMVMKGEVIARGALATRLPAGYLFLLYESPTGAVAGQSLEETELAFDVRMQDIATVSASRSRDAVASVHAMRRPREVLALGDYLFFAQGDRLLDIRCRESAAAERIVSGTLRFGALAAAYPEIGPLANWRCPIVVLCGDMVYEIVPASATKD